MRRVSGDLTWSAGSRSTRRSGNTEETGSFRSIIAPDVSVRERRAQRARVRAETNGDGKEAPFLGGHGPSPCVYSWYSPRTSTRPPFGRSPRVATSQPYFPPIRHVAASDRYIPVAQSLVTRHVDIVVVAAILVVGDSKAVHI